MVRRPATLRAPHRDRTSVGTFEAARKGFVPRKNWNSVSSKNLEATMDDEKSISEKLTEVIGKAAHSVKNVVSHVIDSASDAAQHAMEANAEKLARIPPARSDPEPVAAPTASKKSVEKNKKNRVKKTGKKPKRQ
jgi:hypothetical protein